MLQMSKLLGSRKEWKNKAVQRAEDIREYRKTKKRHQAQISELKKQIAKLERGTVDKKTPD